MDDPKHSLKKAWIRYQQKSQCATDARGYPVRNFKVPLATTNYEKKVPARVAKRQVRKYGKIHYLRSASHQYAVQALKRDNVYPIICAPKHHPSGTCVTGDSCFRTGVICVRTGASCVCTGANCVCTGAGYVRTGATCARGGVILTLTLHCTGKPWSNVVRSLYWYYLHYCYAEGLNGSSDQAKALLMFLFYGTYLYRDKETPIIHVIRKSVVSGRYRFNISRHTKAYELFDKALDDHPEWQVFLDDMGTGKAPPEYNVMIEKVLRLVAVDDIFSLGSKSLASRESWVDPAHDWRKREVSGFRTGANCVCTGATVN